MSMSCRSTACWLVCGLLAMAAMSDGQKAGNVVHNNNQTLLDFIHKYNLKYTEDRKPELEHDEAWFTINTTVNFRLQLWAQSTDCWKCPMMLIRDFMGPNTTTVKVNTTSETRVKLARRHPTRHVEQICSFNIKFTEYGDYWVFLDYKDYMEGTMCNLLLSNNPMPAEMPILFVFLGLLGLAGLWYLIKRIYTIRKSGNCFTGSADITDPTQREGDIALDSTKKDDVENGGPPTEKQDTPQKKERLKSLDTFRGMSLVIMIFVNYGGGGYWFFEHPPWNGLTVADLVFPWFIFIMGTAMNYSFKSMFKREKTRGKMLLKVLWRAVKLLALGIFLNSGWGPVWFVKFRLPGVLQRFAFTYLIIALMEVVFSRPEDSHEDKFWAPVRDILLYIPEWLLNLALVALFLGLTYGLPVPNCPTGYTGPGGISEGGTYYNCTGGAARYIDSLILGDDHLYQFPTPLNTYQTMKPYDPEGILGILTSVFLCFLGVQSGRIIITHKSHVGRIVRWLIWAVITGAIAAILCKGSQNDGWVPLNKNLWSISFVLTTASFGFIVLTLFYILIDVQHWWSGAPFIYPGMNSIVIYCCHSIFWRYLPITFATDNVHWKMLVLDVWGTGVWVFVAYMMFRKKIFIAL